MKNLIKHKSALFPKIFEEIDEIMNTPFGGFFTDWSGEDFELFNRPETKILNKINETIIEIGLPGLEKEDVKISINKDDITISAETEKKDGSSFGKYSFRKSYFLDENIDKDKISAEMRNGVLSISLGLKNQKENDEKIINIK